MSGEYIREGAFIIEKSILSLIVVFVLAVVIRLAIIAVHFVELDRLWNDFERQGARYRLARLIDILSLIAFVITAVFVLYRLETLPYPLGTTFIAFLGFQFLLRFQVHRFPRTNLAAAILETKVAFIVNLLMSVAAATGMTLLTALYLWWRG